MLYNNTYMNHTVHFAFGRACLSACCCREKSNKHRKKKKQDKQNNDLEKKFMQRLLGIRICV